MSLTACLLVGFVTKRQSERENEAISASKRSVLCKIALHQCFQTLIRVSVDSPEIRKSISYFCSSRGVFASPTSISPTLNPPTFCPLPNVDGLWRHNIYALYLPEGATTGLNVLLKVPSCDHLSYMAPPLESVMKNNPLSGDMLLWKKTKNKKRRQ